MARKKVVGQKLQRQLDDEKVGGPRTRHRGYEALTPAAALATLSSGDWQRSSWVAHDGLFLAVLHHDQRKFAALVQARSATTSESVEQIEDAIAEALVARAATLCRAVYALGATPVWIDGVSRLVAEDLSEHDPWLARIMRRTHLPSGVKYFKEAQARGLSRWHALGMITYLVETTTEDAAKLCSTTRDDVIAVIWDGWVDVDEHLLEEE